MTTAAAPYGSQSVALDAPDGRRIRLTAYMEQEGDEQILHVRVYDETSEKEMSHGAYVGLHATQVAVDDLQRQLAVLRNQLTLFQREEPAP